MANIHVIIPEPSTGGGASAAFTAIQTPAGTYPLATGSTDTLTLAAGSAAISITGDSTTDTITFDIAATAALWNANKLQGRTISSAAPAGGDVLTWNSGTSTWEPVAPSGGGGSGDVVGPASSTTNAIPLFSDTTGKLLKNSTSTIANGIITSMHTTYTSSLGLGTAITIGGDRTVAIGTTVTTNQWSVLIGYSINASAYQRCVGIGYSQTFSGTSGIGVGWNISNIAQGTVCIGPSTVGSSTLSVSIGSTATCSGASGNIAIGDRSACTPTGGAGLSFGQLSTVAATGGVAIGKSATVTASGTFGFALGDGATINHAYSVAIGPVATSTAANQLVLGGYTGGTGGFKDVHIGYGVTNTTNFELNIYGTGASGSNISANNITHHGQAGTGTGNGGHLKFKTAPAGSSGSSLNAFVDMLEINDTYAIIQKTHTSAPADADLFNGSCSFYLDESGNNLMVKVKYSSGTVKTGTVCAVA